MLSHWRSRHDISQSKQQEPFITNKNSLVQYEISPYEKLIAPLISESSIGILHHLFRSQNTISNSATKKRLFSKAHSLPLFTSTPSTESLTIAKSDIDDYVNKCLVDAIENGTEILDLSCIALREIPPSLLDLNGMISMKNSGHITSVITRPSIQLFLQGNIIQEISILFAIQNLTVLSLRNNQLEYIPQSISQLKRLIELNIGGNQINFLPMEITKLDSLQVFNPYPNPFIVHDQISKYTWFSNSTLLQEKCFRFIARHSVVKYTNLPSHLRERLGCIQRNNTSCLKCGQLYHVPVIRKIEFATFCTKSDLPLISFYCSHKCTDAG